MNKKVLCILLVAICVFTIVILVNKNNKNDNKINVTTSFYPMYIASINLLDGINEIEVNNLTQKSTGCVHDYTLTPDEMIKLSTADIFVINGNGMEAFLDKVMMNFSDMKVLNTSKNVNYLENEDEINPHTFVSIENYIKQIKNLQSGLISFLPEYEIQISKNAEEYLTKLNNLNEYAHQKLDKFSGEKIVALHESFEYFANDYGLNIMAIIEEEEGISASASSIKNIIYNAKRNGVAAIVVDEDSSLTTAQMISKETNIPCVQFNTTIYGDFDKNSYIDAMYKNINDLSNVLEEKEYGV